MRVLIVDDEKNMRESVADYLKIEGIESQGAENGFAAQRVLSESVFDAALFDLRMPGMSGLDLLAWVREQGPELPVIMVSAYGDIDDAVNAMKLGARDYLVKPFNPEELVLRLKRVISERRLADEATALRSGSVPVLTSGFVGHSRAMTDVRHLVEKIAPTDATVLITGESGTGKEVTARAIHAASLRNGEPFVPVNIGGIPENLLESELFGYERGAFTGAETRKPGIFELAGGGTLFLDEIGDMPLPLQVKILRALQERKIRRLGGTKDIPIAARIIAATNRDMEEAVRTGNFREDLYYRINVIRIELPPLRDRRGDLPELCEFIIRKLNTRLGKKVAGLSQGALDILSSYRFPGNVRELENLLERAVILCDGTMITDRDLFMPAGEGLTTVPRKQGESTVGLPSLNLSELEKLAVSQALLKWEGKRERASNELGISRRTLLNMIHRYGISA